MRRKRVKRGVSPLLATIILIAITVAAGLVIYNLFFSTSSTVTQSLQIIADIDLIRPGGTASYVVLTITVKNTGTLAISSISVSYVPEGSTTATSITLTWSPSISSTSPLSPGTTASASLVATTSTAGFSTLPVVGKVYVFIISVTAVNSQTATFQQSAPCVAG